jgi:aspartyl-tRNA(Asn)/glutamyl-tRNA(Gln) amidotransferase subunit A
MHDAMRWTLVETVEALRAKRLSALELMDAVLARIDETNRDLNAVVAMYDRDELRAQARAADVRIGRGEARPLEGIPFGVKDLEDAKGLVTSFGSVPFKGNVAERDCVHVARLRAAGAIPVGKTNAPEFGYTAITKNRVYGVTRSPWNLEHTPGGSSGGSSAAIAGCVLPMATASDGGGSIRIPASFTGTFGLKVSYGRVPTTPELWPFGDTGVYGPLTKAVEDAALYLDQVVGAAPEDPNSLPHPGLSYLQAVRAEAPRGLRIGWSPDLGYAVVQSDVAQITHDAARAFEKLGHRMEDVAGGPPLMGREWARWGSFEQAARLNDMLPAHGEQFGRAFIAGVKQMKTLSAEEFGDLKRSRTELNRWCQQVFERYDVLVTPTVPYDPPPAGGPFPEQTEGRKQVVAGVAAFTIPFNLSWHPAATVRAGISSAGLPVGLQIVGPRHRDDLVLQLSRAFERERPWHPHWPAEWKPLARAVR